jgi:hypothetical protein
MGLFGSLPTSLNDQNPNFRIRQPWRLVLKKTMLFLDLENLRKVTRVYIHREIHPAQALKRQ